MQSISSFLALKKNRTKIQFDVHITIESLTDVPLVQGLLFTKWRLWNAFNDQKGSTQSLNVKEHGVTWDCSFDMKVTLIMDLKEGALMPCYLNLDVRKETLGGKRSESIGVVQVDLAEYAASPFSVRQYLLQQSKMNSSLKIAITMKQVLRDAQQIKVSDVAAAPPAGRWLEEEDSGNEPMTNPLHFLGPSHPGSGRRSSSCADQVEAEADAVVSQIFADLETEYRRRYEAMKMNESVV